MTAFYKNKKVKIIGLVIKRSSLITHPVLYQVKIEHLKGKEIITEYIDANLIELKMK